MLATRDREPSAAPCRRRGTASRSAAPPGAPPPPRRSRSHADSLPRPPGTGGSPRSITTRGKPPPISTSALPSACFSRPGRAQSNRSRTTPVRAAACGSKWSPRSTSAADSPLSVPRPGSPEPGKSGRCSGGRPARSSARDGGRRPAGGRCPQAVWRTRRLLPPGFRPRNRRLPDPVRAGSGARATAATAGRQVLRAGKSRRRGAKREETWKWEESIIAQLRRKREARMWWRRRRRWRARTVARTLLAKTSGRTLNRENPYSKFLHKRVSAAAGGTTSGGLRDPGRRSSGRPSSPRRSPESPARP